MVKKPIFVACKDWSWYLKTRKTAFQKCKEAGFDDEISECIVNVLDKSPSSVEQIISMVRTFGDPKYFFDRNKIAKMKLVKEPQLGTLTLG